MRRNLLLTTALVICLCFAGEVLASDPKGFPRRGHGNSSAGVRGGTMQHHWRPSAPVAPHHPWHYHPRHYHYPHYRSDYYPHYYRYGHNPRSIIIITPSFYHPYSAPVTVVTSEPYYCHMHHVGFVSRVGFLDHISGTHKIPLETANSICTEDNESCVIEGY
jgi:hypothetical protein